MTAPQPHPFAWPPGIRAAVSLTFDDARPSQLDVALPLLERYGIRATFYVGIPPLLDRAEEWQQTASAGHEIGNHTLTHPCSGNFQFSRHNPLEEYTLERMAAEMDEASEAIRRLVGKTPVTFAYPCGQKFVGRGDEVQSTVPLAAERFLAARGWNDEGPNDPDFCDLAQLHGSELDGRTVTEAASMVENALRSGGWLIFAGHDAGIGGPQTVRTDTLEYLCALGADPGSGVWMGTVEAVARFVAHARLQAGAHPA
ncbi:MAG: polysaccharide deacetylase family protein [Chthonomonadales bacterium]